MKQQSSNQRPSTSGDSRKASGGYCCPGCGASIAKEMDSAIQRGAVIVVSDPTIVTWRGRPVPLSPTEAYLYAHIFRRGRVTVEELDRALLAYGARVSTRALLLGHIRSKFLRIGACAPFERLGPHVLRLQVDPDGCGHTMPVIGIQVPRFATAR